MPKNKVGNIDHGKKVSLAKLSKLTITSNAPRVSTGSPPLTSLKSSLINNTTEANFKKKYQELVQNLNDECSECFITNLDKVSEAIDYRFKTGDTLLSMAVGGSNSLIVKVLLEKGADSNILFNQYGYSLLMDAAFQGDLKTLRLLLHYNAKINLMDKEGKTALIYASKEGHFEICQELLKNRADRSVIDLKGKSAQNYAEKYGFSRIVKLLQASD